MYEKKVKNVQINAIIQNSNAGNHFRFCFENGSDDYLFVLFKCNCTVYTESGYQNAHYGDFAVFDCKLRQEYFTTDSDFVHDYFRFIPTTDLEKTILSQIKMHHLFTPVDTTEFDTLLYLSIKEFYSNNYHKKEMLDRLIQLLLLKVSEYSRNLFLQDTSEMYSKFLNLRIDLHNNPQNYDSVTTAANTLHISKPYFQSLYKSYFDITFTQDVISARIQKAKQLLKFTQNTIYDIAFLCGYSNVEHFTRQFKKETGFSPTSYRNK